MQPEQQAARAGSKARASLGQAARKLLVLQAVFEDYLSQNGYGYNIYIVSEPPTPPSKSATRIKMRSVLGCCMKKRPSWPASVMIVIVCVDDGLALRFGGLCKSLA